MKIKCVVCKKPTTQDNRPFCSKACKNVDLLRWLKEDYRIPGEEVVAVEMDEEEDESPPPQMQ